MYEPQYEVNTDNISIYVDETYNFDGRIKEVESSRVSVVIENKITDDRINYNTPNFTIGPFKREEQINIKIKVDNNFVNSLNRTIKVKKPPPPNIELTTKDGLVLIFTVTTYGKENGLDFHNYEQGLASLNQMPDEKKPYENVREYKLRGTIRPPFEGEGNEVVVEIYVEDNYGKTGEFEQTFVLQNE